MRHCIDLRAGSLQTNARRAGPIENCLIGVLPTHVFMLTFEGAYRGCAGEGDVGFYIANELFKPTATVLTTTRRILFNAFC